jgi:hypothetical protein
MRRLSGARIAVGISMLASLMSTDASAQYVAKHRVGFDPPASGIPAPFTSNADTAQRSSPGALPARAFMATMGLIGGALVGGLIWYRIGPDCGCEDSEVMRQMGGGVVGGALGAALGAAARESGLCSYKTRLGRGLLGSAAGAVVGVAAGSLLSTAFLAISGATVAELGC